MTNSYWINERTLHIDLSDNDIVLERHGDSWIKLPVRDSKKLSIFSRIFGKWWGLEVKAMLKRLFSLSK